MKTFTPTTIDENAALAWSRIKEHNGIPKHLKLSLDAYREEGKVPGEFLLACLKNDLRGALNNADLISREYLLQIRQYIYWKLPADSHTTPERVQAWTELGGMKGLLALRDENLDNPNDDEDEAHLYSEVVFE